MSTSFTKKYLIFAWIILLFSFVFRMFYSQAFLLVPDETNYWQWARHLAWGYHDQAPMIAWTIKASTLIFGHTELGVRFPSIVEYGAGFVVYLADMQAVVHPENRLSCRLIEPVHLDISDRRTAGNGRRPSGSSLGGDQLSCRTGN